VKFIFKIVKKINGEPGGVFVGTIGFKILSKILLDRKPMGPDIVSLFL